MKLKSGSRRRVSGVGTQIATTSRFFGSPGRRAYSSKCLTFSNSAAISLMTVALAAENHWPRLMSDRC
jgi:hypothetical protein